MSANADSAGTHRWKEANRSPPGESIELDALAPRVFKSIVREAIERHFSSTILSTLRAAEESERDLLRAWAEGFEAR